MYLDQSSPATPILVGHHRGLNVYAAGQGFAMPRVRDMLASDPERYSDLCGRTVGQIMPLLDWRGRKPPFCVAACQDNQVVAAAWAGTITSRETGAEGCNVSFGVRPAFGGMGLATFLSAIAYLQCLADAPEIEFVNIQTAEGNLSAGAIATKLQLHRAPAFDRETGGRTSRRYVTYRASADLVTARCVEILKAAAVDVQLPQCLSASGNRVLKVQPRMTLPPSIAATLPTFEGSIMSASPYPVSAAAAAPVRVAGSSALSNNETLRGALAGTHGLLSGIDLVEKQLATAKQADPSHVPFPLVGDVARVYHAASVSAYVHSLEMVSSECLRELFKELGPVPESDADLLAQNRLMADALFGTYGVTSGADVIEKCLAVAARAEPADAPFPMTAEQGAIWHGAQRTAYQYVLEMLCTDRINALTPQFAALISEAAAPEPADDEAPAAPAM